MGLLPEVEAKPVTAKVPREWEIIERFESYRGDGGVLPESIFNRSLKLLGEALDSSTRGECHFISGAEHCDLERKLIALDGSSGEFFFLTATRNQALHMAPRAGYRVEPYEAKIASGEYRELQLPEDVILMYCILRENTGNVLGASEEKASGDGASNETTGLISPELWSKIWSDQLMFTEALLLTGKIAECQEFKENNHDIFSRRESERSQPKVEEEVDIAYKPPPRPWYYDMQS